MTKTEIMNTLAKDYARAHTVYASMEKQAEALLAEGKMAQYTDMKARAAYRSATLYGIKRAAITLGIDETDFMEAVVQLRNK